MNSDFQGGPNKTKTTTKQYNEGKIQTTEKRTTKIIG